MNERERQGIERAAHWTVEKIAAHFDQQPFPTHDIAYGEGQLLGVPIDTFDSFLLHRIEFFPDAGVVRVTAPDIRIELFRAAAPQPREDGVLVENENGTTRLVFRRDSGITVDVFPAQAPFPHSSETVPDEDGADSSSHTASGASGDAAEAS